MTAPGAPARLLVVDDVEVNRDLLMRRLTQQGHEVEMAANGREALDVLRSGKAFDLVLLDVMMPELDGYQVLEALRADATLRSLPVIMVSAVNEVESVVRCLEAGAEDYLSKPFNPALLRARVGSTLEKKRLRDVERLHAKNLERELEIGRNIQKSFLPRSLPVVQGWEIAAMLRPARQVGGDFYDAFPLSGGGIGLAVGDVCDKGVGAALFVALVRTLLRATAERLAANRPDDWDRVVLEPVALTSDYVVRTHAETNMFATLFFAALDPASGALVWLNAGHEPPYLRRASGAVERLEPTAGAVGLMPDAIFEIARATLSPGDVLLAFTDGVTEARDPEGLLFGSGRLDALVGNGAAAPDLVSAIAAAVDAHARGADPADDIALLAVRRTLPQDRDTP
ncbi:MAG TPA: SpoIIE family protein phosphatase [Thermoanaerobaculia bacterium]|nr:SpoIIE family protein phosphatase [Thermoanaerobaculia bacterium]